MRHNILLGVSGSVAAIKAYEIAHALHEIGDVRIIVTKPAMYFMEQAGLFAPGNRFLQPGKGGASSCQRFSVFTDNGEWPETYKVGDRILHIELRRWAGCLVVAPLSANTLAKMANGIADNLLTNVYRAWDESRPVICAPAMNTMMWDKKITGDQMVALERQRVEFVEPIEKRLACDDVGMGALAPVNHIVRRVNEKLRWLFPIRECRGIPINHHPGAFGFNRRKNHHTGIDLYTQDGEDVYAVESGTVVHVDVFTGPKLGHTWWEETKGVMIEGASGVVNYGEVEPESGIIPGTVVRRGQKIAKVKRVLFSDRHRPDIPGHSTSMLHLELYTHGTRDFADWHDPQKNPSLLDPTSYLLSAEHGPKNTLTWDNAEAKTVG